MSVTWVLNGDSKYEISSKEHLLQLMSQGSLYTDAGTPPADFWDGDYEQTADIDLNADTNITPIGVNGDTFSGSYDGGNFSISNWSYDGSTAGESKVGLFGATGGATLENIKLRGVWIGSAVNYLGFLVGEFSSGTIRNVDGVFDKGSTLSDPITEYGAIAGRFSGASTYAVSVGGIINTANISPNADGGGVTGSLSGPNHVGLRNAAVWPNGLTGDHVGGIAGVLNGDTNMTYCVNAMVGDITGDKCGGIIGYTSRGGGTDPFSQMVNSMKGNITGTTYAGGIVGEAYGAYGNFGPFDIMNYMTGDIVSTNNTSGGIVGFSSRRTGSHSLTISNTINAMNGTVDDATIGVSSNTGTVSSKIDVSFGLTYTTATYGSTSDAFTGTTSTLVPELSYIPLTFTDNASNSYEYQMVFGNVGGHSSYSQYTHAILSKNDIKGPYTIDFDLTSDTTEFVTYLSVDSNSAYTDGSLTILGSSAQVVYDYTGTKLYPLVHWVLNGDSKYEISSKEHLIQLMNSGTLHANEGSVPTNWMTSDYIQTQDIDLEGDSTNIKPIGISTSAFLGEYDGNGFAISNWSYVDPDFATDNPVMDVGLFGYISGPSTIKNLTLDGVCTLSGFKQRGGMVVGFANSANVFNIDCNLSSGSYITQSTTMADPGWINAGTVFGYMVYSTITAITFRGVLDHLTFTSNSTKNIVGGVIGKFTYGTIDLMRNFGTFPAGLSANNVVGGIAGEAIGTMRNLINGMTGDLVSNSNAGGVAGLYFAEPTAGEFINSMKGNITAVNYVGGVIGYFKPSAGSTMSSLMNYMAGDITSSYNRAGGIIGDAVSTDVDLVTSINAMNGDVYNTVLGRVYSVNDLAFIDTSYGLTFTVDAYGTTTPITGLPTDRGLPIVDLTATDADGVVHTFDFVFGNLPPFPKLYCNRNFNDASGVSFPSAVGGTGLTINGEYTTDENGIVLSGADNTLKTSADITFQTIALWFRFNGSMPAAAYNLFDARPGTDSFSNLTPSLVPDKARSDLLGLVSTNSGWVTSLTTTMRYSPEKNYFMWTRNKGNVVRFDLSNFNTSNTYSGTQVNIYVTSTFLDLRDFDYRHIDDSYYGFEWGDGNKLSKSVGGVQSYITVPWPAGHLQGMRYRKSDDKFIFVLSATNKVYMMDPTTEVFTELNSNISNPIALAIGDGDTIYYQTSGRIIMSLDLSSTSNTPVQVSPTATGNNRNIDYYNGKVYVTSGTSFIEVDVATGAQFTISGITIEKTYQAIDPVNSRVFSVKQSGESIEEHGYNFEGADGPGYTEVTGTNPIANTFINGELSDIKYLQFQRPDELISLVFTLTNPVTGPLTLFGDTSDTGSPDVTVDSVMIYSEPISEPTYLYDLYLAIVYPLTITPRALSLSVAVGTVNGATAYRLTSQKTGSPKATVVKNNFTDLNQKITNLTPETEYTIRLYSTDGSGYSLVDESTVTTLENSASSYDVSSFGNDGKFDLTSFDSNSISLMSGVMNEIFTTGDEIEITVAGSRGSKKSKFVNRGSTVALADSEALVAPFSSDAGAGQTFTMELSDASTATVAYDETSNSVTVDGGTYAPGSSFVLDGKKCGVYDL